MVFLIFASSGVLVGYCFWWCIYFELLLIDWMSFIVDNWLLLMNDQLFISGIFIVEFSDWYLYVDLVWDVSIGMSVILILIISSSWVVCVTLEVILAIKIPFLGLFYELMYLFIMCFEILRDIVLYIDLLVSIFTYPMTCVVDAIH